MGEHREINSLLGKRKQMFFPGRKAAANLKCLPRITAKSLYPTVLMPACNGYVGNLHRNHAQAKGSFLGHPPG